VSRHSLPEVRDLRRRLRAATPQPEPAELPARDLGATSDFIETGRVTEPRDGPPLAERLTSSA
jgi:hypothetical protein